MCDNPTLIKNTNFKSAQTGINYYKDCIHQYVYVPCGHCKSCIANRQSGVIQRMQQEERNNHLFFCTLTYNNETLPHLTTSNGYQIAYADNQDFIKMVKRLRLKNAFGRPFRYYAVTELGSKRGRPHMHAIFMVPKLDTDNWMTTANLEETMYNAVLKEWRRNTSKNRRKPVYVNLCTYTEKWVYGTLKKPFDLHYIDKYKTDEGTADVAYYLIKYMLKKSTREERLQQALHMNLEEKEYNEVWQKVKSKHFESENFGQIYRYLKDENGKKIGKVINEETQEYLQQGMRNDNFEYPVYFNQETGKSMPLTHYYKKRIMTLEDEEYYFRRRKHQELQSQYQEVEIPQKAKQETNREKIRTINALQDEGDITTLL